MIQREVSGVTLRGVERTCRELMAVNLFHPLGAVNQVKPPERGNSWNFSQSRQSAGSMHCRHGSPGWGFVIQMAGGMPYCKKTKINWVSWLDRKCE